MAGVLNRLCYFLYCYCFAIGTYKLGIGNESVSNNLRYDSASFSHSGCVGHGSDLLQVGYRHAHYSQAYLVQIRKFLGSSHSTRLQKPSLFRKMQNLN